MLPASRTAALCRCESAATHPLALPVSRRVTFRLSCLSSLVALAEPHGQRPADDGRRLLLRRVPVELLI
jgi:hypothetical protein